MMTLRPTGTEKEPFHVVGSMVSCTPRRELFRRHGEEPGTGHGGTLHPLRPIVPVWELLHSATTIRLTRFRVLFRVKLSSLLLFRHDNPPVCVQNRGGRELVALPPFLDCVFVLRTGNGIPEA